MAKIVREWNGDGWTEWRVHPNAEHPTEHDNSKEDEKESNKKDPTT